MGEIEKKDAPLIPQVEPDAPETGVSPAQVSADLARRMDPARAFSEDAAWPWSAAARAKADAERASLQARLDIFKDDMASIRTAHQALSRAGTMRAIEAAEVAIFEIQTLGETLRLALINRAQLEMTRLFVQQIESLEQFRGRVPPEILDALKERALEEYTARMNRASKLDAQFAKNGLMDLE